VGGAVSGAATAVGGAVSGAATTVASGVASVATQVVEGAKTLVQEGVKYAVEAAQTAMTWVKEKVSDVVDMAAEAAMKLAGRLKDWVCGDSDSCHAGVQIVIDFINCIKNVPGGASPGDWAWEVFNDIRTKGLIQTAKDEVSDFFSPMIDSLVAAGKTIKEEFSRAIDFKVEELDVGQFIKDEATAALDAGVNADNFGEYIENKMPKVDKAQLPDLAANEVESYMQRVDAIAEDKSLHSYSKCMLNYILRPLMAAVTKAVMYLIRKGVENIIKAYEAFMNLPVVKSLYEKAIKAAEPIIEAALFVDAKRKEFDAKSTAIVAKVCTKTTKILTDIGEGTPDGTWCINENGVIDMPTVIENLVPHFMQPVWKKMGDIIWTPLTAKIGTLVNSALGALTELIVGVAGLIPEVGGVIMDCITIPLVQTLSIVIPNQISSLVDKLRQGIEDWVTNKMIEVGKMIWAEIEKGINTYVTPLANKVQTAYNEAKAVMDVAVPILSKVMAFVLPNLKAEIDSCQASLTSIKNLYIKTSCAKFMNKEQLLLQSPQVLFPNGHVLLESPPLR